MLTKMQVSEVSHGESWYVCLVLIGGLISEFKLMCDVLVGTLPKLAHRVHQ